MSIEGYIDALDLSPAARIWASPARGVHAQRLRRDAGAEPLLLHRDLPVGTPASPVVVNANALLSFVDGVTPQERDDVLFSVQFASRAATAKFDRFTQTRSWYQQYVEVLENLGWAAEQFAFARYEQEEGELRMDKAALAVVTAIATQNQLLMLQESIKALEKLAEDDGAIRLFDFQTTVDVSGNFQIGAVQRGNGGALALALGAFYFRSRDARRRFLFFSWGAQQINFWTAAQKLTLNAELYAPLRERVRHRLGAEALEFIEQIEL